MNRIVQVEGKEISISNPDKKLFPGVTKWDWILHLSRLAPWILSYARGRYLTTIRYPNGVEGDYFYQKNAPAHTPDWIQTARWREVDHILLQDAPTLIWLGNLACLEFHVSFDRVERPGYPTELVFDLDPSVEGFEAVMETAHLTREVLNSLGLDGVVKTSGATGLQLYVPIQPKYPFAETRRISHFVARYLQEKNPRLITLERQVKRRGSRVYFDYLQHWQGKSLITVYSPRARREATLSVPLRWEELKPGLTPTQFTLNTVHRRLKEEGDLFAPIARPVGAYDLSEILTFISRHEPEPV